MRIQSDGEEQEFAIFYSEYGYIQTKKSEYEKRDIVQFSNIKNNLRGEINKLGLSTTINIKIKTLYGDRKVYCYSMGIHETISQIIKKIILDDDEANKMQTDKKNWPKNNSYRIISTKGIIKELNCKKKIYQENIQNNETLILAPTHLIRFSDSMHGNHVALEHERQTATKLGGEDHEYSLLDYGFSKGFNYCEFSIDTEPDERNILIGITTVRMDYYFNSDYKNFWGWILSDAKKVSNNNGTGETKEYGKACSYGDKVGVLMEFKEKGLEVTFYKNKENMGVAFTDLPHGVYYPCVSLFYEGTRVSVTNSPTYPDDIA